MGIFRSINRTSVSLATRDAKPPVKIEVDKN